MSDESQTNELARKTVLYRASGVGDVTTRRDVAYGDGSATTRVMDIYSLDPVATGHARPAVIIVAGYPDDGFERVIGCKFKQMGSTESWATLIAASGMVGITYSNREPASDLGALLEHVRRHAGSLGVDPARIALFASSGNVPLALWQLVASGGTIACAVLCYGYTVDLDGSTAVADAAAAFRFANPLAGRTVTDLPHDVPLFVARAGRDETPQLNEALDRFVAHALERNLPLTLVNLPNAPHAFDLVHDSSETRDAITQILRYLRHSLDANGGGGDVTSE